MGEISLSRFADSVSEIMPTLMREFARQHSGGFYKIKVTMPQFVVLNLLNRRGESSMSDLALAMGVTTAAMTGIADRLVREGYVIRLSDPKDRRIVRIKLTPKGAKVVLAIHDEHKRMTMKVYQILTPAEREAYLAILVKVRDSLLKDIG